MRRRQVRCAVGVEDEDVASFQRRRGRGEVGPAQHAEQGAVPAQCLRMGMMDMDGQRVAPTAQREVEPVFPRSQGGERSRAEGRGVGPEDGAIE